jgi:hypothetical protein
MGGGLIYRFATYSEEVPMILSDAKLSGKITYKGKPVPYALVIVSNDTSSSTGPADAQGNYTVDHAPVGAVEIGVNTAAGRGMMMSAVMAARHDKESHDKPSFIDIPPKYFNPKTSGLTTTVSNPKDNNSFDIVIK